MLYACMWTTIVGVVAVLRCVSSAESVVSTTNCIQRDPNTRDVLKVLKCTDGCCGNEMTYQVCCEVLHPPNRMYTQYDLFKGWNPASMFMVIVGLLALFAAGTGIMFIIIRVMRNDKRTCSWI